MTEGLPPPDPARGLRRLVAIAVITALAGAGAAFGLLSAHESPTAVPAPLFSPRFAQAGFITGTARLDRAYDADADLRRLTGTVTGGRTSYVVARCDVGTILVTAGAASATADCIGRPVGVIALQPAQSARLTATVTGPQYHRWGVAIYR